MTASACVTLSCSSPYCNTASIYCSVRAEATTFQPFCFFTCFRMKSSVPEIPNLIMKNIPYLFNPCALYMKLVSIAYIGSSFKSCISWAYTAGLRGTQRHGFIAPEHHKGELEHSLCICVPRFLYDQSYRVVPMTNLTWATRPWWLQQRWLTKHYGEANVSSYNVITSQAKKCTIERNMSVNVETNDCA